VQVASLAVVESVGAAGGGGVVSRWLISKAGECEAVWVEQRGREAPWLVVPARRRVSVFDLLMVAEIAAMDDLLAECFDAREDAGGSA
jgi:hypothetical protein